jgi:hypothetical protein
MCLEITTTARSVTRSTGQTTGEGIARFLHTGEGKDVSQKSAELQQMLAAVQAAPLAMHELPVPA